MRRSSTEREHREVGAVPVEFARLRPDSEERERHEGSGTHRVPPGKLPRALPNVGKLQLLAGVPSEDAATVAAGALHRGRTSTRKAAGCRGQVSHSAQVPPSANHMGRRGDELLLQGEVPSHPASVVH